MFVEAIDISERIFIINHSDLVDATILDNNYSHLINDSTDPAEKQQFVILRTNTQLRIKELTQNA